jgi:hypothetical protein
MQSNYRDIDRVDQNVDRLKHTNEAAIKGCKFPYEYVQQGIFNVLETTEAELPVSKRRANTITKSVLESVAPRTRFNKYEQVWLTVWYEAALDWSSSFLAEYSFVRHPDTWTDATGGLLEELLREAILSQLTKGSMFSPRYTPSPSHSNLENLQKRPLTRDETASLVDHLTRTITNQGVTTKVGFYPAFNKAYNAIREDPPEDLTLPETATQVASLLDGLQYLHGMDGSESIESEQVQERARSDDWTGAIHAFQYHALQRATLIQWHTP